MHGGCDVLLGRRSLLRVVRMVLFKAKGTFTVGKVMAGLCRCNDAAGIPDLVT